jgi:hypothetical protein
MLILSKYRINIILSSRKTTNNSMATLRTAFMQTYHSTTPGFCFLYTIPCLLSSLFNSSDHPTSEEKELPRRKFTKVSSSFEKLDKLFRSEKDRFNVISTLNTSSLHEITNSNNSDFYEQRQEGNFVHAL